jgi:hypothetical protein
MGSTQSMDGNRRSSVRENTLTERQRVTLVRVARAASSSPVRTKNQQHLHFTTPIHRQQHDDDNRGNRQRRQGLVGGCERLYMYGTGTLSLSGVRARALRPRQRGTRGAPGANASAGTQERAGGTRAGRRRRRQRDSGTTDLAMRGWAPRRRAVAAAADGWTVASRCADEVL